MSDPRTFSDEELTAYLDGEVEPAARTEIERALAQNAQLRARLDALSLDKAPLQEGLDALLASAPQPPSWEEAEAAFAEQERPGRYRWRRTAVAAAFALVIGFGGGVLFGGGSEPGWQDYVASYHALYSNNTLAYFDQPEALAEMELARVSSAIGKSIELPVLAYPEQLDYKRAQILSFESRPLIQLAFLTEVGTPIVLCIIPSNGADESAVRLTEMEGMSAAVWSKGGYEFILIGGQDDTLIAEAAALYAERI